MALDWVSVRACGGIFMDSTALIALPFQYRKEKQGPNFGIDHLEI